MILEMEDERKMDRELMGWKKETSSYEMIERY